MDAPPPQLRNPHPFDLLELLSSLPDVFINNLLPALEARHAAALALTCSTLRGAVQHNSATQLSFSPAQCCLVRGHQLGSRFPNVRHLLLRPGNLHEAMNVVPLVLMVRWGWVGCGAAAASTVQPTHSDPTLFLWLCRQHGR
jgi:hypothetical protein